MHLLLRNACNPTLSLLLCIQDWRHIAAKLRESPRKRRYQCETMMSSM